MLAFLDDDAFAAVLAQLAAGDDHVALAGQLGRLGVVDDQEVGAAHDFAELVALRLDPDVDGVGEDEARVRELVEDVELQVGTDVAEHHERRREVGLGQARLEVLEDVELEVLGVAAVVVLVVASAPGEGAAGGVGEEAVEVDTTLGELVAVAIAEVMADDADDAGRREVARREARVGRAAAEDAVALVVRGDDAVVSDGADDEDGIGFAALMLDTGGSGHEKRSGRSSRRR